ncbi:hypothetical protein EJB05_24396 [Eragrostis curvula]|uniref:EGF-like domain-containing protein n=1 Tax=Eragrostis curvula TaxID=38414 RepID=A0A5J9V9M8_9POAL|nr:hypothetical protein EJB05_24396 [Eragrostis curvula]
MARTTSATFLFHLLLIVLLATGAQIGGSQFTPPVIGRRRLPPQTPAEAPPGLGAQTDGTLPVLHHGRVTPPSAHGAQTDGSKVTILGRTRMPPPTPVVARIPGGPEVQADGGEFTMPILGRGGPALSPPAHAPPSPADGGEFPKPILGRGGPALSPPAHAPPSPDIPEVINIGPRVQADGGDFTLPILGRGGPALLPPAHAPPNPDVPKVINIGPCLRSHNEGDIHTFCLKQCMNIGYVGGQCDILPNGFPGGCSCQNHI